MSRRRFLLSRLSWGYLGPVAVLLTFCCPPRSAASEPATDAWTTARAAFLYLRPDAPGLDREFIQALEAAGGHVSVLSPPRGAWVYATDEVLAKPEIRRWISKAHRGRIPESEVSRKDHDGARAARSWNFALQVMEATGSHPADGAGHPGEGIPDARVVPVPLGDRGGPLSPDRLTSPSLGQSHHLPMGAGFYDTSEYMAGSVAVGVWLLEAAGSEFDWDPNEEAQTIGGVMAGMDTWVRRGGAGASLTFVLDIRTAVPVSGVPILNPQSTDYIWIGEALTASGFSGPNAWEQCTAYNNSIRDLFHTNWCFSIFVVDSEAGGNQGLFLGGGYAWAYLGGPWVYMSRYSTWAYNAFAYYGVVPMHEAGHIFYATDEYDAYVQASGYLNAYDTVNPSCIMNQNDSTRVCQPTRDQLGWRDLDGDGIIEALDIPPTITLDPTPSGDDPATWTGSAAVTAVPNQNPYSHSYPPHNISIATIDRVELRLDAEPWTPAIPADGVFDSFVEAFRWTGPTACDGTHTVRARAHTTAGNWSDVSATLFETAGSGAACGPWVDAPDTVAVSEGTLLEFTISASDPDGDPIHAFSADLTALPQPNDAAFQTLGDGRTGSLHWTTTHEDAGVYPVGFTATNTLTGSATTWIRVWNVDRAPVLDVPGSIEGTVGTEILIDVAAVDPDGDAIEYLIAGGIPTFATFEVLPGNAAGRFRWTPVDIQAGTYVVSFTAGNALFTSAATTITVMARDQNPVVTAPDTIRVDVGQELVFTVEVWEPNGEFVEIVASGLPTGATFTDHTDYTGTFRWIPDEADRTGSPYTVLFTATNPYGLAGQAATVLIVNPNDLPPAVTAPGDVEGAEGTPIVVTVTASDPDGQALASLSANLDGLPANHGATFASLDGNTRGVLSWTPGFNHAGSYAVIFSARNDAEGNATTRLIVADVDRPPVVAAPGSLTGMEGGALAIPVTATDPDGDPIESLTASPLPVGASFAVQPSLTSARLDWTPDFSQSGVYSITIAARSAPRALGVSGPVIEGTALLQLTIADVDRAPLANAGGPYRGVAGAPVTFDGRASSDPDGDPLQLMWGFGDGLQASGALAVHAYETGGVFLVVLAADDGRLAAADSTSAEITGYLEAEAFLATPHRTLSLAAGSSVACVHLEPVERSYENEAVDFSSLVMRSEGTGTVSEIAAETGKAVTSTDLDRDGTEELALCFRRADLRQLFSFVSGRVEQTVAIDGRLTNGTLIHAEFQLTVIATGTNVVTVTPNPLTSEATLTWRTDVPGYVRLRLYDARGRLLRTLLEEGDIPAGYHDLAFRGVGSDGARLAGGIYFIRVETPEGVRVGRLVVVR